MRYSKETRRKMWSYIIGKLLYWLVVPFQDAYLWARGQVYESRRRRAIRKADSEAELLHKKHYVVCNDGRFHVYNKGGLLNLAKELKKKYGYRQTWKELYIYETK